MTERSSSANIHAIIEFGDIMICQVFNMAISRHVEFLKGKILFKERVRRTEAHHHAKYGQNWSITRGNIVILRFLKMAIVTILNF